MQTIIQIGQVENHSNKVSRMSFKLDNQHVHQIRQAKCICQVKCVIIFFSSDFPTATPTPAGREYIYATGGMAAVMFILFLVLGVCIYLLFLQSQQEYEKEAYADSELPLSFSRTQSESTVSRRSPYNIDYHSPYAASEV